MKNRLPVNIENLELPDNNKIIVKNSNTYGYANILYIVSIIITGISVLVVLNLK